MSMDNSDYIVRNPNGELENRCSNILWNCKGEDCDYHYEDADQRECPICKAKRDWCMRYRIKGRKKCMYHGGKALRGVNNPNYRGKGLSVDLPTRLMEIYRLAMDDPDLLNATPDIALLETRIIELKQKLRDDDYGVGLWSKLKDMFLDFKKARRNAAKPGTPGRRATEKMNEILYDMEEVISQGYYYDEHIWDELQKLMVNKNRLRTTEMKRRKEAEELITPDQFKTLFGYVINSINTRITNADERMAVMADIQKLQF